MKADPLEKYGSGDIQVRRRQILFGEARPLEPEEESLEAIARRLDRVIPEEPKYGQSPFIQNFMRLYSDELRQMAESKIIEAEVTQCRPGAPIVLDISPVMGVLDISEPRPPDLRVGMRLWVAPLGGGSPNYSLRLAAGRRALSVIESIWAGGISIEGTPIEYMPREGWVVDIQGFKAALPEEEVDEPPLHLKQPLRFSILHFDTARYCVILSRKNFLRSKQIMQNRAALRHIKPGDILDGLITSVGPSSARVAVGGVWADLEGVDAGFGPPRDNLLSLQVGQKIRVSVLDVSPEKICVGLRQLSPDPWVFIKKTLQPGSKISVTVLAIHSDRVRVELKEGIPGEIPWKEAGWQIEDPSELTQYFRPGETIEAACMVAQKESGKVILSVKSLRPDPLPEIQRLHPVGSRCKVTLVGLSDSRARVMTENGHYGVVLPEDLSWTGPVAPARFFEQTDRRNPLLVETLLVDPATRLIRFGLKQAKPDPFLLLAREIEVGGRYEGRVVKIIPSGALMEIRKGLVGLLRKTDYAAAEPPPAEGQTLQVMVVNIQPQQHRITLSRRAVVELEERQDIQPFLAAARTQEERKVRMKDVLHGDVFKRFFEKHEEGT